MRGKVREGQIEKKKIDGKTHRLMREIEQYHV